ncbi:MAG: AMP-binding protein [Defluviicoccus sp.]|nr:AMP-binding protein [Defluviicoccus sp.]MDE0384830.1 AMP-binding protein [Defluviicoccus sp.]
MKLATLFAQNARRHGDRVALVCGGRGLTFAELDANGDRLADALARRGVGPGDRVAVTMANSIELVEAMAAILKLGGLIVPLSTRLAAPEVGYIIGHCEPRAVLYGEDMRDSVAAALETLPGAARIVAGAPEAGEEGYAAVLESGAARPPPAPPAAEDDCMIVYTSGTTGRPKGAVGTNANIVIAALVNAAEWGLDERDVVLATTAMAHRTGISRLANMLVVGCRLVMQPRFDAADALALIERERVTVAGGVPTVFRMMMPELERRPEAASSLRLIAATGEVFPVPLKQRLKAALPHVGLYTFLAQTEAGFVAGLRPEEQAARPHATGRPIMGVEIRAVDAAGNDVVEGEPGELLVRSGLPGRAAVMREYFRDPKATEAAFDGDWFRTGDVGYFDADGFLYFVDRAKDMIVTGGLNVYSKEVEIALVEHEAVADAAVVGVPDEAFGEAVAACVVLERGALATADELIEHCRARIAGYKKPRHVHVFDELPRTGTGKVVKQELKRRLAAPGGG